MPKPVCGTATDYIENNPFQSDAECDQRNASLYTTRNKKLWEKGYFLHEFTGKQAILEFKF